MHTGVLISGRHCRRSPPCLCLFASPRWTECGDRCQSISQSAVAVGAINLHQRVSRTTGVQCPRGVTKQPVVLPVVRRSFWRCRYTDLWAPGGCAGETHSTRSVQPAEVLCWIQRPSSPLVSSAISSPLLSSLPVCAQSAPPPWTTGGLAGTLSDSGETAMSQDRLAETGPSRGRPDR